MFLLCLLSNGKPVVKQKESYSYPPTQFLVELRFLDSSDEDFSGHQHHTIHPFYNLPAPDYVTVVLQEDSLPYTTVAGGTMMLLVTLDVKPADNTTVRFSIDVSEPDVASVIVGSTLVFTSENYNTSHVIVVKGQDLGKDTYKYDEVTG